MTGARTWQLGLALRTLLAESSPDSVSILPCWRWHPLWLIGHSVAPLPGVDASMDGLGFLALEQDWQHERKLPDRTPAGRTGNRMAILWRQCIPTTTWPTWHSPSIAWEQHPGPRTSARGHGASTGLEEYFTLRHVVQQGKHTEVCHNQQVQCYCWGACASTSSNLSRLAASWSQWRLDGASGRWQPVEENSWQLTTASSSSINADLQHWRPQLELGISHATVGPWALVGQLPSMPAFKVCKAKPHFCIRLAWLEADQSGLSNCVRPSLCRYLVCLSSAAVGQTMRADWANCCYCNNTFWCVLCFVVFSAVSFRSSVNCVGWLAGGSKGRPFRTSFIFCSFLWKTEPFFFFPPFSGSVKCAWADARGAQKGGGSGFPPFL